LKEIRMSKFLKAFAATLFILAANSAFAQYGTWMYNPGTRSWVPPGAPIVSGTTQAVPQYNQYGQLQGYTQVAGQPVVSQYAPAYGQQMVQQFVPQGNGLINNCSVIGAVIGGGGANVATHHDKWSTVAGALLGGAVGNLICSNANGQRVQPQAVQYVQAPVAVQQQPQVVYVQAPQAAPASTGFQQVSAVQAPVRGIYCNIDGEVTKVASNDECDQKALKKAQALMGGSVQVATTSQGYDAGASGNTPERQEAIRRGCKSPTAEWRKLNWPGENGKPDHPMHNQFVCMEPSDTHR
jgi:hypothetical protein